MVVVLEHFEMHFVEAVVDAVDVQGDQLDHLVQLQVRVGALAVG